MGNDGLCRPLGGFVVSHFLTRFIIRSKNRLELFVCSFGSDGRGILKRCHLSCSSEEVLLPFCETEPFPLTVEIVISLHLSNDDIHMVT